MIMKITKFVLISILAIMAVSNWACKDDNVSLEQLSFNGIEITAKGKAKIAEEGGVLLVSDLGNSKEDAISYSFPRSDEPDSIDWNVDFTDPNLSDNFPDGAKRIVAFKNEAGQLIGEQWIEKRGDNRLIGFDYSSLGANAVNIELLRDGELIDVIEYTQNSILMKPAAAGSNGFCICCTCVPIICFPEGCVVQCTYRTVGGFSPSIAGYENINGMNIQPIVPETSLSNTDNVISTMELYTENIESISISAIRFN